MANATLDRELALEQRRYAGAQLVRRLVGVSIAMGGFVSAQLRVLPSLACDGCARRAGALPFVAVVLGEPPADGILDRAPILVALLGAHPTTAVSVGDWLHHGAAAVWEITAELATIHTARGVWAQVDRGGTLVVPALPALSLSAAPTLQTVKPAPVRVG